MQINLARLAGDTFVFHIADGENNVSAIMTKEQIESMIQFINTKIEELWNPLDFEVPLVTEGRDPL